MLASSWRFGLLHAHSNRHRVTRRHQPRHDASRWWVQFSNSVFRDVAVAPVFSRVQARIADCFASPQCHWHHCLCAARGRIRHHCLSGRSPELHGRAGVHLHSDLALRDHRFLLACGLGFRITHPASVMVWRRARVTCLALREMRWSNAMVKCDGQMRRLCYHPRTTSRTHSTNARADCESSVPFRRTATISRCSA